MTPTRPRGMSPKAPPDLAAPLVAKILVVDDDERNAFAAVEALADLGCDLVVARSGADALRRVLEEDFAVILLDLHMPGMDGFEAAELIRARKRNAATPIVFLTAIFRDEAHVFQAYSAGAVDVVFKPVDPFILKSKVRVLRDLYLKSEEMKRQAAHLQWLVDENARVRSEKALAEQALRRTEARQRAILSAVPIVLHSRSVVPPFAPSFLGGSVEEVTGYSAEAFLRDPEFGSSRIHPDDLEQVTRAHAEAVRSGAYACEYRWRCADETYRVLMDQGVLAPSDDGEGQELFGVILDATERRSLEEQLAQAHKMEAVGQLTGGIAHDFNNLLTVVLGNVDMLGRRVEEETRRSRRIDAIRQAAERGRDLTHQLLAFSRRQNLRPEPIDVNALVRSFAPLLRQAMGEAVAFELDLSERPLPVVVDPTQLETALLNLAINARDAMPEGGSLRVRTRAFRRKTAGAKSDCVCIEVSDTGAGMTEDVRSRVFEPFFTTKDVGKGSGLGLSQVYGFVRQSDGEVTLTSAPGEGATFEILLPRSNDAAVERAERPPAVDPRGDERVLVVEDNAALLSLAADMIGGLGYQVVVARNAVEALDTLETDQEIALLFSDVVMPGGVDGVALARMAQERRPDLKILLTSGFVSDRTTLSTTGYPLLDKPYELSTLATQLRQALACEGGLLAVEAAQEAAAS